jgi:hypothetical protein
MGGVQFPTGFGGTRRLGLGDTYRSWMRDDPRFDWGAFTWLPRVVLLVAFLAGMVIAAMGDSYRTAAGSVAFGMAALAFTIFRPRTEGSGPPPAPRGGFKVWIRHDSSDKSGMVVE